MDAAAVKYNLERHKNMKGSNRRGELAEMSSVEVVDASTVRINLSAPFAPLLAVLTDRSGMMVSPKAAEAAGEKFGAKPVCSGPFRFVERIAQDRIVLERFPNYWNKGQIHFERIVYQPIPDATVRLANLRSGQLDFIERLAPSDVPQLQERQPLQASPRSSSSATRASPSTSPRATSRRRTRSARTPRVREAFELSIDREALVKVAMEGEAQAGNQWVPPSNRYYAKSVPMPKRNVERAKQLLKEAGVTNPSFTLMTPTASDAQRIAQVVQAMAKEAGFDVKIQSTEFATALKLAGPGAVRGLRARLERPRRPGRQPAQFLLAARDRSTTPATARTTSRRGSTRRAPRSTRRSAPRPTRRSRSRCRRTGRSSTCSTATGCGRTTPSSPACAPCPTAWCACRV